MRRPLIAAALTVAALALAVPAAHAADPCSNAQYRKGAAAKLPDCRAWEQATPVDKKGYPAQYGFTGQAAWSGNRVLFNNYGDAGGADALPLDPTFASTRGSGWTTDGVDAAASPPSLFDGGIFDQYVAVSDDGSRALTMSLLKLTPDAVAGASNVYVRNLDDGSLSLAVSVPGRTYYNDLATSRAPLAGGTPDFSHLLIFAGAGEIPGFTDSGLFDVSDGRLSKVDVDANGADLPSGARAKVSDDGGRITFGADPGLYQRVDGNSTVSIARSRISGASDAPVPVSNNEGWPSADGRRVIFALQELNASLTSDGPGPFYRWDADGADGTLTSLLAGVTTPWSSSAGNFRIFEVSPDGRYVWFSYNDLEFDSAGNITGSLSRFDVLDTTTKTISEKANFDGARSSDNFSDSVIRFSPDGTKMIGLNGVSLTGYDQNCSGSTLACKEAFVFDAEQPGAPPVCVSCGPAGTRSIADARLGSSGISFPPSWAITDDGRAFFGTRQQLSADDANLVSDVYEYTPGRGNELVSGGSGGLPAAFISANPSGTDVFFHTANSLVPQDGDANTDIYDARVGGGLAAQQVAPALGGSCASGKCPGAPTGIGAPEVPGSSLTRAQSKAPAFRVSRVSSAARRAAARTGRLRVGVTVGAAGRLSARATARVGRRSSRIAHTSATMRKAGRVTLTLALSRGARRTLARERTLRASLSVSYSRASKTSTQKVTLATARSRSASRGGAR